MPKYTFVCQRCGEYDIWKSMNSNLQEDTCPECSEVTNRIYKSFRTNQMDSKLYNRINSGMTPKLVKRENLPKSNVKQLNRNRNPMPWTL
ncbi:zinc ribbon domain-containing protein [Macrococcus equipercicus]|uniref:Zinc ribbon domain-containing protein n=1 Tax=Macrococcus equipercicus TaxID=69967 RepID=A0A9Q9BRC8_9STAP|nr:zinc ribbon domain-containing protein [Macrococcus equipercicus]